MSKARTALARLRQNTVKQHRLADRASMMDNLEDSIIDSMVGGISRIGDLATASDGGKWRVKSVLIYGGVSADMLTPRVPVVEMDGMELFDALYKAAGDVASNVMREFIQGGQFQQDLFKTWLADADTGVPAQDSVVRAMEILMAAQGWRFRLGKWMSPAWLYPPMDLHRSVLQAHVTEEFESKALVVHAKDEEIDSVLAVAGDL